MNRCKLETGDPRWPATLDDLGEVGPSLRVSALWVDGELPPLPGVAVVGARRASAAGAEVATRIGRELGRRGITVVSGLAVGVDTAAHRGCLAGGGRTVAVLGCGLDVDYPPQNRPLRELVVASGALVSEYGLDDAPIAWRFPNRNRIIAAMARAVVVVEARAESGALSTARWAADLGREVLAVPGSILSAANAGSNRLLRDGVRPYLDVTDLADVFDQCGDTLPGINPAASNTDRATFANHSSSITRRLLELLGTEPVHREVLGRALDIGAADLAVLVGELELAGSVRSAAGGFVSRSQL
ncbi:MAG: DNA-processing protein DprA [Candidatus Dormiibacterota bacterium]